MARADPLKAYKAKRNFNQTSEPEDGGTANHSARAFVIQKHWASQLHYDFRLELEGTMKSWAVPKGPSIDPKDKRMAVQVEDHPITYNRFEGEIPAKQYGAGKVIIWDKGTWEPLNEPEQGYRDGDLQFVLHGHKLHGNWALIRIRGRNKKQPPWLLIKKKDAFARPASEYSVVDEQPDSVAQLPTPTDLPQKKAAAATNEGKRTKSGTATRTATKKSTATPRPDTMPAAASKAALPTTLAPQLATLVDAAPSDPGAWLYEAKYDGYRLLARIQGQKIALRTRNGNDWSHKLPALVDALREAKLPPGWYDGEIVLLNDNGVPDFQALQGAFDNKTTQQIVYFLFDLPFYGGFDLRPVPLAERRTLLQMLLDKALPPTIRFSDAFVAAGDDILASACRLGLEGVIGKKKDALYVGRRSPDWIKLKCSRRQEFVIGGYTDPKGSRTGIGSLLLGVHDENGKLRYAGKVGTGFNDTTLLGLKKALNAISHADNPFAAASDIGDDAHWVAPKLVAEISFAEWTKSGRIRQAVFHALRKDKPARAIVREEAMHMQQNHPMTLPPTLKITSPEREIDPSSGITKIELLRFYALVAPLMMPQLKSRPVSLLRAPDGITKQLFFQKHLDARQLVGVVQLSKNLDPDHQRLLEIERPEGVLSMVQMNVIEFHTWNAIKTAIDKPDRMILDLDPGKGVEWGAVQESALLVKAMLDQLGLASFVKTSGGRGLHVVVPLAKRYRWDVIKDFSRAIVEHLAGALPARFVAKSGPRNRVGKIFIDYLRNGFGATTVCAWSARARPGLGVSVPIGWNEVKKISSGAHWTVGNIHTRLDQSNTSWEAYSKSAQGLAPAMKMLGFKPDIPA